MFGIFQNGFFSPPRAGSMNGFSLVLAARALEISVWGHLFVIWIFWDIGFVSWICNLSQGKFKGFLGARTQQSVGVSLMTASPWSCHSELSTVSLKQLLTSGSGFALLALSSVLLSLVTMGRVVDFSACLQLLRMKWWLLSSLYAKLETRSHNFSCSATWNFRFRTLLVACFGKFCCLELAFRNVCFLNMLFCCV